MKKVTKAVNTSSGKGYPEAPEPVKPGANPPDPAQRQTSPQTMTLREAAGKNYIKPVQSTATGGTNFVINHGRLHANGYRLLKEGKEVRSRVISEKNEQLYTIQADPKLIGSAPETVKDDFAADPSNPQQQVGPASKSAFEEAKDYVMDLADQGLLGEKLDQSSLENYARALTGVLPIQQDGTDPNKIAVDMLRKKIEENSGSEVASALFNVDPEDPSHVDLEQFIKQIREKQKLEGTPEKTKEEKKEGQDEKSLQEKMEFIAEEVLPVGFILFDVKSPAELRSAKARIVAQQGLQTYEGMVHGFVQQMAGLYLKHLKIPVSNLEDFLSALSTQDSSGNYNHFDFIKTSFMKLGYNATDAAKKAENYLDIISRADNQNFFYLSASGINRSLYSALNLYNISDGSINPDDLYKDALGTPAAAAEDEKPEDPKALEKEKALKLKQALQQQYLTDEELEYGILHILQKPKGYASLTIDLDRALNLEDHLHRKLVLALKNDGKLEELLKELQKIDILSIDELLGKFDIQPSKLKNIDETIEEAKQHLFDVLKTTPTGVKADADQVAEHLIKINLARMKVQVLQDVKAAGMTPATFDKEKVKQYIEKRNSVSLTTKIKGLFDWANGDITPEKDYPMVTDSGIAERQQQLAFVFEKPADVKNAGYEKLKQIHKEMAQIGRQKPEDKGISTPKAKNDELAGEIANVVEGALQGKDLNILKVSKDLIYELNNTFIEMSQLGKDSTELDNKRNILEKFLASRGLSPAGAKAAADAVLQVVKGLQPMSRGSVSVNQPSTESDISRAEPTSTVSASPRIEDILAKLQSFKINKIPKPVQGNLEKLKTYLELNNAQLSDGEIQELFKHFNPEPPQFSFEEYVKRNPNRFNIKGNKAFIVIDGQEIPIPENVRASAEQLSQFIKSQEEAVQLAKRQKIEATKKKVLDVIERLDNIGKVKKQDVNALVKELVESGMNEGEARLLVEKAIADKKPILEAQVQAARKGLANSAKVRSIFTSDGKSLTSDEIYANISNLSLAVFNQISNYYFSDNEALSVAEKIVVEKYQEAKNKEKIQKVEEQLGFERDDNDRMSSSGEVILAINGKPTPVKVKRVNKGYEFSTGNAKITIPATTFSGEKVDFDPIAQELEALIPQEQVLQENSTEGLTGNSLEETGEQPQEVSSEPEGIKPEIKNGKLTNVKDVASSIVGSILAGRPVRLTSPLSNLNEDSWMALADAISKSKTFKKLKLSPNVADDIVFRLTSANPEELEFDLSDLLSQGDKPKEIEYDEFGNVIRKSMFSAWKDLITKTVDTLSNEQLASFSLVLVIENYINSLKQAGSLSEDDKAELEMLINDLIDKNKLSTEDSNQLLAKLNSGIEENNL